MNLSNNDGQPSAEREEGRPQIEENTLQPNTHLTQGKERVSQGLERVRTAAREHREMRFTALLHHMTVDLIRESFYALKRKAAPGVDGVTWHEYETGLEERLVDLHGRVHRGAYRAQPSKRKYIEKSDGRLRPLGIAAWRTKSSRRPRSPSSTRFMRRIFSASRTASARGAVSTMRWMHWHSRSSTRR